METQAPNPAKASRFLKLRVTNEDYEMIKKEAEDYGYDISTILRLRFFGKIKGMRITRRPRADVMLLGDIIGRLTDITGELNKNGTHIDQIPKPQSRLR